MEAMGKSAVVAGILPPPESQQKQANLAALVAQTEKSQHYHYLKEFRVEQCQQFKEHKCTQHRPYICFFWHFPNQRRRRPIRRKDGTFNYSPDIYCTKYDENSGICPDGEECPFLHRVSGDVERKYHLRYYKTCLCVHPTDTKGHCSKNGPHCAFAHGPDDLRPPVFDIRDLQIVSDCNLPDGQPGDISPTSDQLLDTNRTNYVVEDPVWEDQIYVLANYKTELCKKPPRLCRQGYACPYYHNSKDKRRTPRTFKYRSTPCPGVKHGDEWGDPETCEQGDYCSYCHTRTEQQFHPEIYKSTKCNDMVQHGYCPRGPFCAFAHTESEMKTDRESAMRAYGTTLATLVNSELDKNGSAVQQQLSPPGRQRRSSESILTGNSQSTGTRVNFTTTEEDLEGDEMLETGGIAIPTGSQFSMISASAPGMFGRMRKFSSGLGQTGSPVTILRTPSGGDNGGVGSPSYSAVLKQRHLSGGKNIWGSNGAGGEPLRVSPTGGDQMNVGSYPKAIGFEREMAHRHYSMSESQNPLHNSSDSFTEAAKIKASLYIQHDIGCSISAGATNPTGNKTPSTPNSSCRSQSFSFTSPSAFFTPTSSLNETNSLAAGLCPDLDDFPLHDISFEQTGDSRKNSFVSNATNRDAKGIEYGTSAPVSIPRANTTDLLLNNFVSPPLAAARSFENGSIFRMSSDGGSSFSHSLFSDFMSTAPTDTGVNPVPNGIAGSPEAVQRQNSTTNNTTSKANSDDTNNIRKVCLEWKSHAEELAQKLNKSEEEKQVAIRQRDEALQQVLVLSYELARLQQLAATQYNANMDRLNSQQIQQLSSQLKLLMERYNGESRRCGQQIGTEREPICGRCGRLVGVATTVDGVQTAQVCPVCSPITSATSALSPRSSGQQPTASQPVITANGKATSA